MIAPQTPQQGAAPTSYKSWMASDAFSATFEVDGAEIVRELLSARLYAQLDFHCDLSRVRLFWAQTETL
jgi:hypothetical protein